jgi:magnesium transporter
VLVDASSSARRKWGQGRAAAGEGGVYRSLYRDAQGAVRLGRSGEEIAQALANGGVLWVDLDVADVEANRELLRKVFGFHPLAVDDALVEHHVPKVDDWERYLYVGLHAAMLHAKADEALEIREIDIFVGPGYLVTHQHHPAEALERLWAACQRDERLLQRGATHLLYRLADELADDYMRVVDDLDEVVDQIEDDVLAGDGRDILATIMRYKRALLHLRRVVAPQREVMNKLARGDDEVLDSDKLIYFRDVYDHYVRLTDIAENLRDLVSSALDTHLSVINNRLNEVVRTLTVITVLFAPITFLSGFFGMNFFQASGRFGVWTGPTVLVTALALMVMLPVAMALWLRKRAWM